MASSASVSGDKNVYVEADNLSKSVCSVKNGLIMSSQNQNLPDSLTQLVTTLKRCQVLANELDKEDLAPPPVQNEVLKPKKILRERQLSAPDNYDVMEKNGVVISEYEDEREMDGIMSLITKDLSEPYSIYTYRYFIHNWPNLCLLARLDQQYVGAIVCKLDKSRQNQNRGYIAMLAVDEKCRRMRIGTRLVCRAIENMQKMGCDEVVLETEVTNAAALRLYENLGFVREKRLFRYYLNGVDAFRLKLWFSPPIELYMTTGESLEES